MNICWEIIKNYEQLSSTISKFQALFQKFAYYSSTFLPCFEHFLTNFPAQSGHASACLTTITTTTKTTTTTTTT